jgi:hypothetical protein
LCKYVGRQELVCESITIPRIANENGEVKLLNVFSNDGVDGTAHEILSGPFWALFRRTTYERFPNLLQKIAEFLEQMKTSKQLEDDVINTLLITYISE